MPEVTTELEFGTAFQLLCATLLSAQCTDKRINQVTPALFRRYPTPEEMAKAEPEDVFEFIRSVSYPNSKAKHLVEMARMIVANYGGEVPEGLDELVKLPGVGRKTANVIQAVWFGKSTMAVDTHVFRVANRLGLADAPDVLKTEHQLMQNIPQSQWSRAHHWLIYHGRRVCAARKPACESCTLRAWCEYANGNPKGKK